MATNKHDRIKCLRDALSEGLYEKDEAVRLALLTAIAGESIFFLGAPGCAKSMIARRVVQAFKADGNKGIKYFETLLNQFSTPEEVFGNMSLKALNGELEDENGEKEEKYLRLTKNMLPEADIAFLDEIWKASPAILNTLLTIINERKFHNGGKVENVPLKALFAASNELPAKDRGLEALYDRFILRLCVGYIQNEDNFFDMIQGESASEFVLSDDVKKLQITNDELQNWKTQIDKIILSEEAKSVIIAIRKELSAHNEKLVEENKHAKTDEWQQGLFEVGDRRWKKITHILKTSAFLNDRSEVDLMDCQLIEYCIWSTENQQKQVREIVEECIKQNGLDCDTAIDEINEQIEEFKKAIDEQWFEEVKEPATDKVVTINGTQCYECIRNNTNETWYVTKGTNGSYVDVYNQNKQYHANGYFQKNGNNISCWQNFTVKRNPAKTHLEKKELSDIAQETSQKTFDRNHYKPIVDKIHSEINLLKEKKEADAIPFKANLFADQEYNESITAKLDDAIHLLQDAEVDLNKEHARYFNSDLSASFSLGDAILKDGTVFSADEVKSLSPEQKNNIIAIICIAEEKSYAISLTEKKAEWKNIKEVSKSYGESLPKEFAEKWIIPNKENLNKIWENMAKLNEVLGAIEPETQLLSAQEYWSLTTNGDSAAYYQLFDERGHQDHTTKDHNYAVRAIREWKKE